MAGGEAPGTVTVSLADSLGAPVADEGLTVAGGADSAGLVSAYPRTTDARGDVALVLAPGAWTASAQPIALAPPPAPRLVAAGTFIVPIGGRATSDTVLVHLRLSTASTVRGVASLAGAIQSGGIAVNPSSLTPFTETDSTGAWQLGDLPPGTWVIRFGAFGYAPAFDTVIVTHPGSSVVAMPVTLHPGVSPRLRSRSSGSR
ncbi:MAG TPA: hypothetical protein VMH61_00865 [Candidatus Acidoferrales bacterium]|nr:hypothetical protein [Candidatus Acidoferrales bacterium]